MNTSEFIKIMDSGAEVIAKSETHMYMTYLSNEAMMITAELNNAYHTPEEIGALMKKLTGRPFPEGAYMFPPFYTDCGKNIKLGRNVFINAGCQFQDQGGITIGDAYNGQLIEYEDSYVYTLSVPNQKNPDNKILTVRKEVAGSSADLEQEFTFTLTVTDAETDDTYEWYKNGIIQSEAIHSGDTFNLKHNEMVQIAVPLDAEVTVSEQPGNYTPSFKLDDGTPEQRSSMTFTITDDRTLLVTNTLGSIVPTGIFENILWFGLAILPARLTAYFLWFRKKRNRLPFRRR